MDKNLFWQIIDTVNSQVAGDDYDGILRVTREELLKYPPEEIARWGGIQRAYRDLADTGGIFAAGCMLNDYMSSDGFLDFRMWLISRGRDVYMAALKNPGSLTDIGLPADIRKTMETQFEIYGYVANDAYAKTGNKIDFYDMMDEIHPMSDEEQADLSADVEYFPCKISDQTAAKRLLPNLYARYITPDVDFCFTYRTDEDEAIMLLSESPDGLKGIALRLLEKAKESIRCRSKYLDVTGQLGQDLTALQHAVTGVLDDAMLQIRDIGLDECVAELQSDLDEGTGLSFS